MGEIVISPLAVRVSSRKSFILNLNRYRNAHYQTLNKAKKEYRHAVKQQVRALPGWRKVSVRFTIFPKTAAKFDVTNVCCIHDKFLLDAVVSEGKLPDDNYHHVVKSSYHFGHIDKHNPRVEAEFIDMDE